EDERETEHDEHHVVNAPADDGGEALEGQRGRRCFWDRDVRRGLGLAATTQLLGFGRARRGIRGGGGHPARCVVAEPANASQKARGGAPGPLAEGAASRRGQAPAVLSCAATHEWRNWQTHRI